MDDVGLLDERFFFYFEETDWACRMREAGWKVFFVPGARFFHAQGQSVGPEASGRLLYYRSRYQYLKKWFEMLSFNVCRGYAPAPSQHLPDWNRSLFHGFLQTKIETEIEGIS